MVMEVLSEGVLQPKLMDEEVEKATNKNTIIYSRNSLFWLAQISWLFFSFRYQSPIMLQWDLNIMKGQGTGKTYYNEVPLYQGTFPYNLLLLG